MLLLRGDLHLSDPKFELQPRVGCCEVCVGPEDEVSSQFDNSGSNQSDLDVDDDPARRPSGTQGLDWDRIR